MSGRAAGAFLLAALAPAAAGAVEIRAYDLRLDAAADGSARVAAAVDLAGCRPGEVVLPLGLPVAEALRLTAAPPGALLAAEVLQGRTRLRLTLPQGTPEVVALAFELTTSGLRVLPPADGGKGAAAVERLQLRHELLATQEETIGRYRVELVFPEGWRAHAVREALPRLRKAEPGPRAALAALEGGAGVRLEVAGLRQGETAALQVELVPARRSPVWWIAGLALCLLYLFRFRDLVSKPAP